MKNASCARTAGRWYQSGSPGPPLHVPGSRRVVVGRIHPPSRLDERPLFERFHARGHDRGGDRPLHGDAVCTGNASMRRADDLEVLEHFRGVREELGSLGATLRSCGEFLERAEEAETPVPGVAPVSVALGRVLRALLPGG